MLIINQEQRENLVATGVDVASILVAYQIGIHQMNPALGFGYALLDAWIVVWNRKRLTRLLHRLFA